jgi:Holliday junction DNA helicase RuvB
LSAPLRDRFGITFHLDFYDPVDMAAILSRSASLLQMEAPPESLAHIASRARRTPRIGNRLLKRVRDFAQVRSSGVMDEVTVEQALSSLEIDKRGLDEADRRTLRTLIERFQGGPVGLNTLAAATAEEMETLEDVIEPFLLQEGFLMRTPRGRCATDLAYTHLGYPLPVRQSILNT